MCKSNSALDGMLRPIVTDMGYVFWGMEQINQKQGCLLRIYIDSDAGISLADCERVSHQVAGVLDVEDPVRGGYRLEISSPGFDRPLFTLAQYEQFIGEVVRLHVSRQFQARKRITGRIEKVCRDKVVINEAGTAFHVPVERIEKARLVPRDV